MKRNGALFFLLVFFFVSILSGCTQNTPKIPFSGENSESLSNADSGKNSSVKQPSFSKDDVWAAFNSLCQKKGQSGYAANNDDIVQNLGVIDSRYELYLIIPADATGDQVITYGEFQGFKIVSGMKFSPSAFALYLFDAQNQTMYTVEDGERLIDFSKAYQLLPQDMKQ